MILVLTVFSFNAFCMDTQLHCLLLSMVNKEDLDGLRKPRNYGEPMSQGSNWSPIDRYGESLHSSEVVNARELKFCEGCGVLHVRLRGSKAQFCFECDQAMATAMERTQ